MSSNIKDCGWCGEPFAYKRANQKYCKRSHYKNCEMCGEEFIIKQLHRPGRFCSPKCGAKYSHTEEGKSNSKLTIRTKTCQICNKEFTTDKSNQIYCSMPHDMRCFHCNKRFKISRVYKGRTEYSCGSVECKSSLTKDTNLNKYGVDNVFKSEKIKNKIKQTNMERYGVSYPSKDPEIMAKVHKTMIDRYGAKTPMQSEELKQKIINTLMNKYGVDNPGKSEASKEKAIQTNKKRYGVEYTFQSEEIKDKIRYRNIEKYGTSNPRWHNEKSRAKAEMTNIKRYGHINPFGNFNIQEKALKNNKRAVLEKYGVANVSQIEIKNYEDWIDFKKFTSSNYMNCYQLSKYFNVSYRTIRSKAYNTKSHKNIKDFFNYSQPELHIKSILEKFGLIEMKDFIPHERSIIPPKELDFYIPKANLAIEVSPTYYHRDEHLQDEKYHYDKYEQSMMANVDLITIFDWNDEEYIISLLYDKIVNENKKNIKNVSYSFHIVNSLNLEHKTFYDNNVIMSNKMFENNGSFKFITLENDNEILAIAKFKNNNKIIEIIEIAQSKMYSNAMRIIAEKCIELNAEIDCVVFNSKNEFGYNYELKELGFKEGQVTKGELIWANDRDNVYISSHNAESALNDELKYNSKEELHSILEGLGFVAIYDCGNTKWLFIND